MSSLFFELSGPFVTFVAPGALEGLCAPWVSIFEQFCPVTELDSIQHGEGVTVGHSKRVLSLIASSSVEACNGNHPVVCEFFIDVVPEFIRSDISMLCIEERCAGQGLNSWTHPATG